MANEYAKLVEAILAFWFGAPADPDYLRPRRAWFRKDPDFDTAIRDRFLPLVEAALGGELAPWAEDPRSALALIILLDQFPRNLFRGEAQSFAGDAAARVVAEAVLDRGWDQAMAPVERLFAYLPFEHSESLADQERSLALYTALAAGDPGQGDLVDYARRHHEIIARFGRFPHRNAALGRESTPEEEAFLAQPGSGF